MLVLLCWKFFTFILTNEVKAKLTHYLKNELPYLEQKVGQA